MFVCSSVFGVMNFQSHGLFCFKGFVLWASLLFVTGPYVNELYDSLSAYDCPLGYLLKPLFTWQKNKQTNAFYFIF
ncbi:hypothetical protein PRUPE_6G102000 [Prunus persica]|uniref:Uncharacterized protein n=1 Tax=Prunus persica TaxID=3760 RepID=M5VXW8_PRUPE|nr:hypothetical protein PRUPE_6G102000 [Prunus persica]